MDNEELNKKIELFFKLSNEVRKLYNLPKIKSDFNLIE